MNDNTRKELAMRLFIAAALVSFCSACAIHASQGAPFHWSGKVEAGKAITIRGVNGSIHAEHSSGTEVDVTAVRSAHRSNPDDVRIYVKPTGDGYTVCALYPGDGNDCEASRSHMRNNDTEVEFTVHVPSSVRFNGRTVNGSVTAESLRADVDASTVNGKIDVSTQGTVAASTVNGNIHASMGRANWSEARKFHTVNGSIDLDLPSSANADIRASTVNGSISSDFPLMVHGKFGGRSITGTIGAGGRELQANTVNGSIHLRQHNAGAI
jgi:Putative adhesin